MGLVALLVVLKHMPYDISKVSCLIDILLF